MTEYSIVTSMSKKLLGKFGYQLFDTYKAKNMDMPIFVYTEDSLEDFPVIDNVTFLPLPSQWYEFRDRNKSRFVKTYLQDAVRFSSKVFSQVRFSISNISSKFIWMDADCIFIDKITDEWADDMLNNSFVAFYDRPNFYTECGIIFFDLNKNVTTDFFKHYENMYLTDNIYNEKAFTDCHAFDATRKSFLGVSDYSETKLGDPNGDLHIMARDPKLAPFIDHKKGDRKRQANSPEWLSFMNK